MSVSGGGRRAGSPTNSTCKGAMKMPDTKQLDEALRTDSSNVLDSSVHLVRFSTGP